MTITREQVADLQPGDVVEITAGPAWPGTVLRGEVFGPEENRCVGPMSLNERWGELVTLTVVSRAPRPLYVNHPRTEPVPGDVVRREGSNDEWSYTFKGREAWAGSKSAGRLTAWVSTTHGSPDTGPHNAPKGLRLLVDGETGQVVP